MKNYLKKIKNFFFKYWNKNKNFNDEVYDDNIDDNIDENYCYYWDDWYYNEEDNVE